MIIFTTIMLKKYVKNPTQLSLDVQSEKNQPKGRELRTEGSESRAGEYFYSCKDKIQEANC